MFRIKLAGTVVTEIVKSHTTSAEEFYITKVATARTSGVLDTLPCIVPALFKDNFILGEKVAVKGEIRSRRDGDKLMMYVFVMGLDDYQEDKNEVTTDEVTLGRTPQFRTTPSGREIADLFVHSYRPHSHKRDGIHVVAWGRNASYMESIGRDAIIEIKGRFQSREYEKKLPNGDIEVRVAYEVSASNVEVIYEDIED